MARIHGVLGAEKTLIEKLREQGVHSLNSLSEIERHLKHSDSILAEQKESERGRIAEELKQMKEQHGTFMETRTRQRIARRDILAQELEVLKESLDKPTAKTRNPIKWFLRAYQMVLTGLPPLEGFETKEDTRRAFHGGSRSPLPQARQDD